MAAYFHYVHVILIAGIIVSAAADDLVILHPDQRIGWPTAWLLIGGPAIYIVGNGLYKRIVYGWFPLSHWVGLGALAAIAPFAFRTDLLMTGGLTTAVMIVVAVWESVSRRGAARTGQVSTE
jgi:low temperature requirement protein LtrA